MSSSDTALPDSDGTPQGDSVRPRSRRVPRKQTFSERWRRMSLPNQLMFGATVVIAIATVVNVGVFIAVSISGSRQTDKLVEYANRQAQAANDISDASDDFTDSAHWMEEHMQDVANAMQDNADAAQTQAKASQALAGAAKISAQVAQLALQPAIALRITMGEITDTSMKYQLNVRNEGGSPARIVAKYCTVGSPRQEPITSFDTCTPTTSGPFTVLPHNDYPVVLSLSAAEGFIKGKAYVFMPVEITYPVLGKPHTEWYCFTYRPMFRAMSECADLTQEPNKNPN
jgi:hypothetical protein